VLLEYNAHSRDRFDNWFLVDVVAVMGDVLILVCNFLVPLGLKVVRPVVSVVI
jgi:hypothetical protein